MDFSNIYTITTLSIINAEEQTIQASIVGVHGMMPNKCITDARWLRHGNTLSAEIHYTRFTDIEPFTLAHIVVQGQGKTYISRPFQLLIKLSLQLTKEYQNVTAFASVIAI